MPLWAADMGRRLSERFNRTQELRKLLESPDRLNAAVDSIFAEKDINRDGQLRAVVVRV